MDKKAQVEQLTTYMANFVSYIGKVLPDDIKAKIDELAEKEVISDPEFFYPFINEPIDHTAEITIQVKEGVQLPIQPTAVIPPLKYNKSWLFMLTQDDCKHAAFCYTWAAIHGKPLSKKSFYDLAHLQRNELPSDYYYLGKTLGSTDGAGNEVRFSLAQLFLLKNHGWIKRQL